MSTLTQEKIRENLELPVDERMSLRGMAELGFVGKFDVVFKVNGRDYRMDWYFDPEKTEQFMESIFPEILKEITRIKKQDK